MFNDEKTTKKEKKLKENEDRKKVTKQDYRHVITEDGTLASFNFNDNYKTTKEK